MFLLAPPGARTVPLGRKDVFILARTRVCVDTVIKVSVLDARGGMCTRDG